MTAEKTIQVRFLHPTEDKTLTLSLPRETPFSALTELLYREKFVPWQKPGYRFICCEHFCGMIHTLGDYIPAGAGELELKVFHIPVVLM